MSKITEEFERLKKKLDSKYWNAGDYGTYYSFFCHGWFGRMDEATYQEEEYGLSTLEASANYKIVKMLTLLFEYSSSPYPKVFKEETEILAKELIKLDSSAFSPEAFYHQNNYLDYDTESNTDNDCAEELFNRLLLFVNGSCMLGDSLFKLCLRMGAVIYEPSQYHKEGMKAERLRLFSQGMKNKSLLKENE